MNFVKKLIFILFLLSHIKGYSQIEVRSYPINLDENTRLNYVLDYFPKSYIQSKGAHLSWDLSESKSPIIQEILINKTKLEYISKNSVYEIKSGNNTVFFSKNKRNFNELGFILNTENNSHIILYKKPLHFTTKYLKYGATFSNSSSFDIQLMREELPKELINKLPVSVREIKLVGKISRKYHCDAGGRFILEDDEIAALRLRVDERVKLKLYDVGSGNEIPFIEDYILKEIYDKAGENKYYLFFSNAYKYYFARVDYDKSSENYTIIYQSNDIKKNALEVNSSKKIFLLYPNPTYNIAKMLITNYGFGKYKLEVYNIIGKKLWENDLILSKSNLLRYDFSFLRKGTYIIALKDKYGKLITTRKLVIISV